MYFEMLSLDEAKALIERRSTGEGAEFLALMPGGVRFCVFFLSCLNGGFDPPTKNIETTQTSFGMV